MKVSYSDELGNRMLCGCLNDRHDGAFQTADVNINTHVGRGEYITKRDVNASLAIGLLMLSGGSYNRTSQNQWT